MNEVVEDERLEADLEASEPEIKLSVTTHTTVNISAKLDLPGGGYVKAKSMAKGIKLTVNKQRSQWYEESLTVPSEAFEAIGRVFDEVRKAREEVR